MNDHFQSTHIRIICYMYTAGGVCMYVCVYVYWCALNEAETL